MRALGKVRARIQRLYVAPPSRADVERTFAEGRTRNGIRADAAQEIGDAFGIADSAKQSLDAGGGKCGEEVLQVEAQEHVFAGVGRGEGHDGAPFDESVNGGVGRNAIENAGENPPLQLFEARLRAFGEPDAAGALGQNVVVVVLEPGIAEYRAESFEVREPIEFGGVERQPRGEIAWSFDDRKIPLPGGLDRLHTLRLGDPFGDGELAAIFPTGAQETGIIVQEPDDLAVARTRGAAELFDEAGGEGPQPAPGPSQRADRARMGIIDGQLTGEKTASEDADDSGWHERSRRETPTSLTLRELVCSPSQVGSRDEMAIQESPPG